MVLPGVQALFGFQLVAVFNQPFTERLALREQGIHLVALFLTAVAAAMLMAPAAYHRQAEPRTISEEFLDYASRLLTGAMVPLMLGLTLDVYVITMAVLGNVMVSGLVGLALFGVCGALWFVVPLAHRS
jgi:hypothetical protein